jgi:hypothetical protein
MNIAEYYQSRFYPDLDISVIQEKLSVPDVFSKAVSLVHQTHYPDLPIETVAQSIEQPIRPPKVNYDLNVSDLRGKDTLTGKNIGTGLTTKTTSDLVKSIVKKRRQQELTHTLLWLCPYKKQDLVMDGKITHFI